MAEEQAASPVETLCHMATTFFHFSSIRTQLYTDFRLLGFIANTSHRMGRVSVFSLMTLFQVMLVTCRADDIRVEVQWALLNLCLAPKDWRPSCGSKSAGTHRDEKWSTDEMKTVERQNPSKHSFTTLSVFTLISFEQLHNGFYGKPCVDSHLLNPLFFVERRSNSV